MVKPIDYKYPSAIIHEALLDHLFPIYDKDGNVSFELMLKANKDMIDYINYLAMTGQSEQYRLLMNIMYDDYLVFMDHSRERIFSPYLNGCNSYEELMTRLENRPQEIMTLINAFTSYHQVEKRQEHIPHRRFATWTKVTTYENELSKYIATEDYLEERALFEVLSDPAKVISFAYILDNEKDLIYKHKNFVLSALVEYYRASLTLDKYGITPDEDLFAKLKSITSQTTALELFDSLTFEEKYQILNLYVYLNTNYDQTNINLRENYAKTEKETEEFQKRLK